MKQREIKFRMWNGNIMAYFNLNYLLKDIAKGIKFIDEDRTNQPIMQFTGLRDKNGKDIYEGDILRCEWDNSKRTGNPLDKGGRNEVVVWEKFFDSEYSEYFLGIGFTLPYDYKESEIIGNIYENPNLSK